VSETCGLARPAGLGKLIKVNYLLGCRIQDLPPCSIVPEPLRYPVPSYFRRDLSPTFRTAVALTSVGAIQAAPSHKAKVCIRSDVPLGPSHMLH
jgi:hypothetical protein